jgi:hypothetical protein|tara:strand:- start:30 stop:938 length:909 start_codon:yes stop_codon:yes gene_type:complete
MAEQQQVELDTDGFEEQEVQVAESKPEIEDEKIESVDLGYTDPIKPDQKAEVKQPEENKEDNLQDFSQGVQKRINQLTRKLREAERKEKAALDYAKGVQSKYSKTMEELKSTDKNFVDEYEARVDIETDTIKAQLKNAYDSQDTDKIADANQKLTALAVEKEKAKVRKQQIEEEAAQDKETIQQQQVQPQQQPQVSAKTQQWMSRNDWFGKDKVMSASAFAIHEDLVSQGFDPESDEYYTEIDKNMQDNFPHKFAQEKPIQTVASAGRKQQGRRTVKLTKSQQAIARRLGVPLEEYAKHVKG